MIDQSQVVEKNANAEAEVFEGKVAQIKLREKNERIIGFLIPFLKATVLTAAILYIFNRILLL